MRILSLAPLAGEALERIRDLGDVEMDPWSAHVPIRLHSADELVARLDGVDVLIVEADHIPATVLNATNVAAVAVCRGDPVNVDVAAATAAGVAVLHTPGRNAAAVAELALTLTLALTRHVVAADDDVRSGRFVVDGRIPQQRFQARELSSLVVGLVGLGAVGRATARLFGAAGARVIASDPYVPSSDAEAVGATLVSQDELFRGADVVSIHAAFNERTRGLVGHGQLAVLPAGALLVNTARYEIVDEPALIAALGSGRLAGAAFDHFAGEYLDPAHPLASMPNVVLTPHIGGTTVETIERHTTLVADGLRTLLSGGRPATLLNPEVGAGRLAGHAARG